MIHNIKIPLLRIGLMVALLLALSAQAETVTNLYEAEIPVSGQGGEARAEGIRKAFAQVVVKVSGDRGLLSNPQVGTLLGEEQRQSVERGKRARWWPKHDFVRSLETEFLDEARPAGDEQELERWIDLEQFAEQIEAIRPDPACGSIEIACVESQPHGFVSSTKS